MICSEWNVVIVPFPFTDEPGTKKRPALVLTNMVFNRNGHTVLAMITTIGHLPWPSSSEIEEYSAAGLNLPCQVRLKIFTLDNRLLLKKIGHLVENDLKRIKENLHHYFS